LLKEYLTISTGSIIDTHGENRPLEAVFFRGLNKVLIFLQAFGILYPILALKKCSDRMM
jgi:hypothetical protein